MSKTIAILLAVPLTLIGCSNTDEATSSEPTQTTSNTRTEVTENRDEVDSSPIDPVGRYKGFASAFDEAYSKKNPDLDKDPLFGFTTDSYKGRLKQSLQQNVDEQIFYDKGKGSIEDIEFGEVSIKGSFSKDENGKPVFNEGQIAQFEICRTDKSIKKSYSGETLDNKVQTFQTLVEMQFIGGEWKVNGRQTQNKYEGEKKCELKN